LILIFNIYLVDEDDVHNNPNLHSEEQDEFELPDSKNLFFKYLKFSFKLLNLVIFYFRYLDADELIMCIKHYYRHLIFFSFQKLFKH
jgi:hypothetical protein